MIISIIIIVMKRIIFVVQQILIVQIKIIIIIIVNILTVMVIIMVYYASWAFDHLPRLPWTYIWLFYIIVMGKPHAIICLYNLYLKNYISILWKYETPE